MERTARLTFGDQTIELPVVEGSEGELAVDITSLRSRTGLITLDPGFSNTGVSQSGITYVDGEKGILRYRGTPIEQLASHSNFVETSFLLIYGHLPTKEELDRFGARVTANAALHESFKHHFEGFPVDAPPMAMLSAMVNTLACFYPRLQQSGGDEFDEEATWLLSKTRTIAAYSFRRSMGSSISMTAIVAPPCTGPHSEQIPAAHEANRFAWLEPTIRTVVVLHPSS